MADLGYRIFIIREATLGEEYHDTFEQRVNTKYGIRDIEANLGHSIGFDEYMVNCRQLARQAWRKGKRRMLVPSTVGGD